MKTLYIAPEHQPLLALHGVDYFEAMWDMSVDWFEEPNQRRGGWSGVGRVQLKNQAGEIAVFFVKKQQNHGRKSWLHPFSGEPTFRREFERLQFLQRHAFKAPQVVFYAETSVKGNQRAILVTQALAGYVAADTFNDNWQQNTPRVEKLSVIAKIATEIKRFHDFGLVHRALYPKHIFVKCPQLTHDVAETEIALIDLEKARFQLGSTSRAVFDLAALCRHSEGVSRTQKMHFLLNYLHAPKLNHSAKRLCRQILKRAYRQSNI